MTDAQDAKHGVPDDHSEDASRKVDAATQGAKPNLLPILPMLLGLSICALNIFVALRLWQSTYTGRYAWFNGINLPTTVSFSVIAISFGIGLFLIAYAIVLQRSERHVAQEPAHVPTFVKWIVVPALVALPAPALTVWAAQMIEPMAPTPCIELYQAAVNIGKDAPDFKMPWTDRDQRRCNINAVLPK